MAMKAETLISYINDPQRIERHLLDLRAGNEARARRTREYVSDSFAQRGQEKIDGPWRDNEAFLPR